jgi:hypothetical protein
VALLPASHLNGLQWTDKGEWAAGFGLQRTYQRTDKPEDGCADSPEPFSSESPPFFMRSRTWRPKGVKICAAAVLDDHLDQVFCLLAIQPAELVQPVGFIYKKNAVEPRGTLMNLPEPQERSPCFDGDQVISQAPIGTT